MVNDFLSIYGFKGLISLRLFFEIMGMLHLFPYNCVFFYLLDVFRVASFFLIR